MKINTYKIPQGLIDDLERIYPELRVTPQTTLEEVYYHGGIRAIIQQIKTMKSKQELKEVKKKNV